METVVGLFDNFNDAQNAAQDLEIAGIPRNDISFVANNAGGEYNRYATPTTTAAEDTTSATGVGAATGAAVGGVAGLLVGLGLLTIPGFGPIAAAGWLVSTLTGAGIGAVAGGLIGALTQIGVPHEDAALYSEAVRRGGTLLAVRAPDEQAQEVAQILSRNNAVNIDERAEQYRQAGFVPMPQTTAATTSMATTTTGPPVTAQPVQPINTPPVTAQNLAQGREGEARLPVVEEDLQVGKREVTRGGVRVYTHVTQKPVEEQVRLREEHVTVDRRPADRPVTDQDLAAFKEGTIEVRETAEEVVINKEARVVEEVIVGKDATERTETVRDTVRRTDVEVEPIAGSEHVSRTAPTFETYVNDFRTDWQRNYANFGGTYEQYEPAYRYGYDLYANPQYRGQNWNTIESRIQNDWNARYPNTWDRMKNSIRYGFDRAASGRLPGEGSIPGIQTGGRAIDNTPDTRGITEKVADAVTGDRIDDKTGKPVR